MLPWLLAVPVLFSQTPSTPLPVVEAKDLPRASRGPMPPRIKDLGAEPGMTGQMRHGARRTPTIPALQLPAGSVRVRDKIMDNSGWRAYAIEVPPGGQVKVHVVEGRKAWFRVLGVNAWGRTEPGLLQNWIHTGEPQATYQNPGKEARTVYFIVDTLDTSTVGEPFAVDITRS